MNKLERSSELKEIGCTYKDGPTCAGLFSGIGGFCEGFEQAGFKTLWLNDINSFSNSIYKENRPNAPIFGIDVCQLSVQQHELASVDVLHAGFPCQSFSGAGARKGFEDRRGKLFYQIIRIIDEFQERAPKVLVLENTPNILIGAGGAWITEIISKLQESGYWITEENCVVLDTRKNFGLPQRRERVFIFAVHKSFYDGNPLTENGLNVPIAKPEPLNNFLNLTERKDSIHYLDKTNRFGQMLYEDLEFKPRFNLAQLRKSYVREIKEGECPTLTANMGQGGHNVPFVMDNFGLRRLTEFECAQLQGFRNDFNLESNSVVSKSKVYEMIGNSVSPRVSKFIGEKLSEFIKANLDV